MAPRLRTPATLLAALLLSACTAAVEASASPTATHVPSEVATPSVQPSPEPAYPRSLTDDAGREVTLAADPQRIVSLAPSNTEIVCALGACDQIVGVNDFRDGLPDDVLAALEDVPDVATFTGVDREAVVAAEPDLVLAAGNELTPSADIEALAELGLPVLVLYPETLDEIYADIRLVGEALDETEAAEALVAAITADVAEVRDRVSDLPAPRTFYEVGLFEGEIYTAGEDSFLASLIELAGGEPITGDALTTAISAEELVVADPEIILLGDAAYDPTITPESVGARPGWEGLTAVREGRVFPMPDDLLITRPGPRIAQGLEALARAIHPEAFE
ncbi:MAG TPA: ABC transporter substrate-binding protein [candidate division Zixibacteria bacterium]|nr:ABC transporter substrate-binding protein [candidate division Zixibacteria bacterium]